MKRTLFILLILFVGIQFIRPKKNQSSVLSRHDITQHYTVTDSVLGILKRSCYDCHSNNTVYPWYDQIQPVAWWLQYHVNHGKHSLNFSEFAAYTPARQVKKLKAIEKQIKENGLPLATSVIFIGLGLFGSFTLAMAIAIPLVFVILYATQLKHLS